MLKPGLEGVAAAETKIGHVDGLKGELVYRGWHASELAVRYRFEEVAYLLWHGTLPDEQQLAELQKQLADYSRLTPELIHLIDAIPKQTPPMSVLLSVIGALSDQERMWPPTIEQALRITALIPSIIAYRCRGSAEELMEANASTGHVERYLLSLHGRAPSKAQVIALNAYMILGMEHGLNASTFAARVVSSTESDLYAAVAAAIGAMKGALHGGAPTGVIELLDNISAGADAESSMRAILDEGGRLMGFGHRIYKTLDPRAAALREICETLAGNDPLLDMARHAEQTAVRLLAEYKPGRQLHTNVEFYAAAVMRAVSIPPTLFTPTFTAARIVGWTAHALEQSQHNRIFRPQSIYTGEFPAPLPKVEES
ncbi:citrate synthase/methylcitrate synthase [Paenibacillaceae bacterium]|nr:citrate synthase/methylcitrate synthase [Paenibacillaceae bacterium]